MNLRVLAAIAEGLPQDDISALTSKFHVYRNAKNKYARVLDNSDSLTDENIRGSQLIDCLRAAAAVPLRSRSMRPAAQRRNVSSFS